MSSSYQARGYQRPEEEQPSSNVAELIGTGLLAGAGLGSIAGIRLGRGRVARGMDPKKKETIRKLAELNKKPAANAGVRQKDLNTVDVAPSKTPTSMKEVYQEVSQPVKINKTPQLTGATKVSRPNTFIDDYVRDITEQRIGEQQVDDALQAFNLTGEARSERARQYANVRRVQAAAADDIIEQLKIEKTAEDMMGPRRQHPINAPDGKRAKYMKENYPVQYEREVSSALQDEFAYDNERAFIEEVLTERRNKRIAGNVDQAATATNSGANQEIGRVKHRLQQNEDVNLSKIEMAEDLADTAIQQQVQKNNIPLTETPTRDAGINLVSSQSVDGLPVDQAEIVATGQGSVQGKQVLENAGLPSGSSSVSDLSTTNVATKPVNAQQFVAKQLSLFDPRPQSFELQDAVTNFDSKVQQLMTSTGMSRARAESLVLGDKKMTTTQGRQLKEKLEQDLLDETGAGTTTGISGRFLKSVDNIETGQKTALDREIRGRARNLDQGELPESDLRSLGSIQDSTVTEADIADVTGGIVGPSTIDLGKRATGQTLKYTGNRPANVQRIPVVEDQPVLVKRKVVNPQTGQEETENILVRGTPIQTESLPLGTRAPRGPVRTVPEGPRPNIVRTSTGLKKGEGDFVVIDGKKVQRETLTGYGPYGTETGKYISGAMDREGKYSNEAIGAVAQGPGEPLLDAGATFKDAEGKTRFLRNQPGAPQPRKPSEPLFGPNMGANERESFKGVPNKGLERIVSQGTYRSGKLSKPARAAQREQKRRTEFNYDPTKISSEDVKTSLQASEEMRRARIEGRNPQDALKTFMRNKGLM